MSAVVPWLDRNHVGKLPRDGKHSPNDPVLLLDFSQVSVELVDLTVVVVAVVADDANEVDVTDLFRAARKGLRSEDEEEEEEGMG